MEKINVTNAKVVRMCNKSVVFELADGTMAFASKRVANDILSGNMADVYIEDVVNHNCIVQKWLATPSRF